MTATKRDEVSSHLRYIRLELREMHQTLIKEDLLPDLNEAKEVHAQLNALLDLLTEKRVSKIKQLIWRLRDDLMDLYMVTEKAEKTNIRTSGKERVNLDILHSLRIALIINSLVIMCKIPKLSTSNKFTNSDILSYGLLLDFNNVIKIIRSAFSNNKSFKDGNQIKEKENYSSSNKSNLSLIEKEIIRPLERNNKMIKNITQLVAVNHGAYG